MAHKTDADLVQHTHNTARFFTENRHVSYVVLLATVIWGVYGYQQMPKRKDPSIPVREAVAVCPWPGVAAEQIEQTITRKIESTLAQSPFLHPPTGSDFGIKSTTLPSVALVHIKLAENVQDTKKVFSDINLKLDALNSQLPNGAGPIQFISDFGDTAALMLTVASPPSDEVEVAVRAHVVKRAIEEVRRGTTGPRLTIVLNFPYGVPLEMPRSSTVMLVGVAEAQGALRDVHLLQGAGYLAVDAATDLDPVQMLQLSQTLISTRLHRSEVHPDMWPVVVIRDPAETSAKLAAVAGAKYSYRELDDFTDLIARSLLGSPLVSKVDRSGVLPERIYLDYSQERLAAYGLAPSKLRDILSARNITLPGGIFEVGERNFLIEPSGQFTKPQDIGNVAVAASPTGSPVYLRDLVDVFPAYESPARYLNFYSWHDSKGNWRRSRAITLAVQMRAGEQVEEFGKSVDAKLAALRQLLPKDLILARTSDQPRQVRESIDLFMDALYEAIVLVVLVSLVGFWEWRSALLMALSIPITLAMTFGMIYMLGIDVQQVSIASLIIALGLLVDDPVVASDAIKRSLGDGHPPVVAAWLGPTKLAKAIMFATVTNIAAYLPFLLVTGDVGSFLYSLPIVLAAALVASRLVSMTFVPLLGYVLLRPSTKGEPADEAGPKTGFAGFYYKVAGGAIEHRWKVFATSFLFLAIGLFMVLHLRTKFFPEDVQYWSYLDIWLPNDTPLSTTNDTTERIEAIIRKVVSDYEQAHIRKNSKPLLKSMTTFVGGGAPRFWFSVSPELQQLNYAQTIIEVTDKETTPEIAVPLQQALTSAIPGAQVDVRQLELNPVGIPIQVMISNQTDITTAEDSQNIRKLHQLADSVEDLFRSTPNSARVRDDWGRAGGAVKLDIDTDRANLAGITNMDVALSSTTAVSGVPVTTLRVGNKDIPVVARLRVDERGQLSDLKNLSVFSLQEPLHVPLTQVAIVHVDLETQRIIRRDHFRTVTVQCFPGPGALPSDVLSKALPSLRKIEASLPAGYSMLIGGEKAKQDESFANLAVVMTISVAAIFLALVLQFKNAFKPLLVFAAVPYGVVGAVIALYVTGVPFGFMAFLGIASLVGVIVSHVIVLFDFIEEAHEKGEPLEQALLDAGIHRLRPVVITVGATVLALFPLAIHGGPLWQPLCYAQIGGLTVATFITLILVPVLFSIAVKDLKIIQWEHAKADSITEAAEAKAAAH